MLDNRECTGCGVCVTRCQTDALTLTDEGAMFDFGSYTAAHITAFHTAPPAVREQVIPLRDRYEMMWTTLLHELFPGAKPKDLQLHRLILFGAMNTTIEWYDPAGATSLDELAAAITDQFLTGVAA